MSIFTSTAVTSSQSPSNFEDWVVFTATVTAASSMVPGPTGSVNFYDGGNLFGNVTLMGLTGNKGQAQIQIASLTAGIHSITAVYSGDSNFTGSTSPAFSQQVNTVSIVGGTIPGLALTASYSPMGDSSLPPQATFFIVPSSALAGQTVNLVWDTANVAYVRITGDNHVDYQTPPPPGSVSGFDTGFVNASGTGVYVVGNGFTASITLTLTAYNSSFVSLGLTSSATLTIT
jgi:hypothetical protein